MKEFLNLWNDSISNFVRYHCKIINMSFVINPGFLNIFSMMLLHSDY